MRTDRRDFGTARTSPDGLFPPLTDADRETLSWAAYGRRYAEQIAAHFAKAGSDSERGSTRRKKATRTREPV